MNYFPMFYNIHDKNILVLGSGKIALNKIKNLIDFTNNITVISKEISSESNSFFQQHSIKTIEKSFQKEDLEGFDIVIAAINDIDLQKTIYKECKGLNILCNCVDVQECCDFIFPSYIKEGDLTVAISTNGASPSFSKYFKEYLETIIPNDISIFLKDMKKMRTKLPKGQERMDLMKKKVKEYMKKFD